MTKHVLLVDAGNSMLKWASAQPMAGDLKVQATPSTPFLDDAQASKALWAWLSNQPADEIWLSSVLGDAFEQRLNAQCQALGRVLKVIQVNQHPLLHSAYVQPERLGKDRWASMLAVAAQLESALGKPNAFKAAVVVSLGTASTIDALLHTSIASIPSPSPWVHLGGFIVPGVHTMLNSLHVNTAQLPQAELTLQAWPNNTLGAIGAGVGLAQVALIQRCVADLLASHGQPVILYLTGGHASALAQQGLPDSIVLPNAVLRGVQFAFSMAGSS